MYDHDGIGTRAVQESSYTPMDMERDAMRLIDELTPLRDAAIGRERKQLSSRIKAARIMRDWARTRAGYVAG